MTDLTDRSLLDALTVIKNDADRAAIRLCIKPTELVLSSACIAHFGSVEAAYAAAKAVMEVSGYFWDGRIKADLLADNLRGMYGSNGQ